MKRFATLLTLALLGSACGHSQKVAEVPKLPPANPAAVSKMAQGVEAAKVADGKKRAIGLMEEAIKADGGLWEAHYDLGVLYAEAGNLAAAERELDQAQKAAPNAEDVAVALAEVRRRRGDPASAIQALQAFVTAHPDAVAATTALMTALREGGKVDAAIDLAHKVLVRRSQDPYVLAELALAHLERGEIDTAELLVGEAQKVSASSAVVERTAGLVALRKGDDAVAFQHFAKATDLDPNDTTARLNIGTVLLQAGVYDRAAEQFRAVRDANQDDAAATLGLAAARRGSAKKDDISAYTEAEKLLKGLLEKEPNNLAATFNLAVLYADYLKRPQEASTLFKRFLNDAPPAHPGRAEAEKWLSAQSTPTPATAPPAPAGAKAPAAAPKK